MKILTRFLLVLATLSVASSGAASDDTYSKAVRVFKEAGQSEAYFSKEYGYALFPTVGKGGFVIGGAHGSGRVYAGGNYVGDTSMTQLSVGLQARASASNSAATNVGQGWTKGTAVFTVAKGGLMYEATVVGQKFSYTARK
jgi:lipid-binding SYLF domain-containing protein